MTRPEFSRALEDSGVRVKGWEKDALLDRFEDGRISRKVTGGDKAGSDSNPLSP